MVELTFLILQWINLKKYLKHKQNNIKLKYFLMKKYRKKTYDAYVRLSGSLRWCLTRL